MGNIIAVDPGVSGAFVVLDKDSQAIIHYQHTPVIMIGQRRELDEGAIVSIFQTYKPVHIFIEKVHAAPVWGAVACFQFGMSYGFIKAVCAVLKVPYSLILPTRWKPAMMDGMPKDKGASIVRVSQLYPNCGLNKKKDHNIADAILIAKYGISLL